MCQENVTMWMNCVPLNSLIIVELGITLVTHADQGYFIKADFFLIPLSMQVQNPFISSGTLRNFRAVHIGI